MKAVAFNNTTLSGGFWKNKQDLVREVTINSVYEQFSKTGRIPAFKFDANAEEKPHIFWDSDVAKWIESVAYITQIQREPELEREADEIISDIAEHQAADGYFNLHYQQVEPENRFTDRKNHELYCLGHLIEAAVAYDIATGKDLLLRCMEKYVDLVYRIFVEEDSASFVTPGHEEIELALIKLYHHTGNEKALKLCRFFINQRGANDKDRAIADWADPPYSQSHMPVREQREAVGHSVRACYLYSGMADLAREDNDEALKEACRAILNNIIEQKMYVTGGVGAMFRTESFADNYYLPNRAYAETCAAISLALFAHRMLLIENRREYADTVERAIYNGVLSGLSLDGKRFFYVNPLEINRREIEMLTKHKDPAPITQRPEVFWCSCCPPNITRFIPSIAQFCYTTSDNCIYVHQFMEGESDIAIGGQTAHITQKTEYPLDGRVVISVKNYTGRVAVRVPGWSQEYSDTAAEDGYIYFDVNREQNIELDFKAEPFFVAADSRVADAAGRVTLCRGPIVYCIEEVDNGADLRERRVDFTANIVEESSGEFGAPILKTTGFRPVHASGLYARTSGAEEKTPLTFIPYYAFANRGESDMLVWVRA